ncbi:hypothetical protein PVAND_011675 [Polypedilum vanderplanki]|uniref:Importin N-terminal domain-containing protein n=1 Tax=Polypedilum vanderplanki TaxID=319348 RepID=A0A9J6CK00_POLVA|nr:hypothetical protein PVAND_011675 [Polypedilum vanderplanki]
MMGDAVKQAIFEELNIVLKDPTQKNEERLNQLKFTENYGIYLAELTLDDSLDSGLRQLASVMLKKYVDEHWSPDPNKEDQTQLLASDAVKQAIKSILPNGLYCNNSKIRNTVAYTISTIAGLDDWIELFLIIVNCLAGNEDAVHGAMQVLIEFTYELEEKVKQVGPIILSEIYRIYNSETQYSVKTRSSAVEILNSILKCANIHIDSKEQISFFDPILPAFLEKLIAGLHTPNGNTSNFNLKTEILRIFTYMISEMPKFIQPFIQTLLPPIWSLLTQMADFYIKAIVNEDEGSFDSFNVDEDEKNNFIKMILQVFELINAIAESKKFKMTIKNVLKDLVYVLILYMQITDEQIEVWSEDIEKFIEDEDDPGVDSIRSSGKDILMRLGEEFEKDFIVGFTNAIRKHLEISDVERNNGRKSYWKSQEAAMLVFGISEFKDLIIRSPEQFNLGDYLNMTKMFMSYPVSPFLLGRCLYVLSKFVETDQGIIHLNDIMNTTLSTFESDKSMILKVYGVRSSYEICSNLSNATDDQKQFVISKLNVLLDGILQLIPISQCELLGITLESLSELLSFDANFTAQTVSRVIPLVQALFLKYHDDRLLIEHILDIVKIWAQNPNCSISLQDKIVPTMIKILNLETENTNAPTQDIALDVLETIVKYSRAPLSPLLIEQAFPAVVNAILRTEDNSVLQSGGECLRAFLFVSAEQVCTFQNGMGLSSILEVLTILLNPKSTESSATFVGRLVITLITKAGNLLGDKIDLLLKAALSKMQLVVSLHVNMSLIMIFAHLFLIQIDAVMNFLSCIPGPTGEPAINFVFSNWLTRQHSFYGTYERKVSVMALCKIFLHGINTQDQRLVNVMVKDLVELPNAAPVTTNVRTRSQAAQTQVVNVPIMVKIFKLLINELVNLREIKSALNNTIDSEEDDDTENSLNTGLEIGEKNFNAFMLYDDDETTEDDQMLQDLMQDPIFQEDTEVSLTKFLTDFSRSENYPVFVEQLTPTEKKLLQSLNITT